jgi:hypothetical protein
MVDQDTTKKDPETDGRRGKPAIMMDRKFWLFIAAVVAVIAIGGVFMS